MYHNVVVGTPLISAKTLLAFDEDDWLQNEQKLTLFTETRFLPAIMKEAGIVPSVSEVRRNRPDLCVTLHETDCINLKWGKKWLYIVVGATGVEEVS